MADNDPKDWNTLDYVGVIMTTLLVVAIVVGAGYGYVVYGYGKGVWVGVSAFLFAVLNFIPFGLITFGFVADMIGQDFRYSIASLIGLLSIAMNWAFGMFSGHSSWATGGMEQPGTGWCMIPGLEGLENRAMPMNLVASSTILTYYIIWAATQRDPAQNFSLYISTAVLLIIQLGLFYTSGCSQYYIDSSMYRAGAILQGAGWGGIGYAIVKATGGWLTPFQSTFGQANSNTGMGNKEGFTTQEHMLTGPGWNGSTQSPVFQKLVPRTGAQCSKDQSEEGDEFVCEAYKNGKLVTEKINA
jgi:hypothetical protein